MADPLISSSNDTELRAHVDRVLSAHYELEREIGRGGMGIVYLARDRRLKRQVAVKLLPPELAFRSEIRSRFLREAETAAQLNHPNIVPIYSVDEREGLVYFVMAFVDGENLAVRLHNRGALPIPEVRRIVREVAEALAYAHARNVVHRDIKPDNILLDGGAGEGIAEPRVLVTDFGIARAVTDSGDSRLTATGMAIGTPAFMSPEQSMGEREIDGRSDLYSLGVVAYQMLAGELPFNAPNTPSMLVKHLSERPRPISERRADVPPDLARAVMMLLEKEPVNRFPSAQALVVALETGDVPERAPALPPAPRGGMTLDAGYGLAGRQTARTDYRTGVAADPTLGDVPPESHRARWNDPPVVKFRRQLAPFFAVSAVSVLLAILQISDGFLGIVAIWSVFVAYRYARLWTDGYDWRDVFRQPKERLFFEVVAESVDDARALFDKQKRDEVVERDRARARARMAGGDPRGAIGPGLSPADRAALTGPHEATVREAQQNRDEILRLMATLPKPEQAQLADVPASARALYQRVEQLAMGLSELDRSPGFDAAARIEEEITRLEAQANPLDHAASEDRVRRLALLKRERRQVAELIRKRETSSERLESCRLALQNMRYDVLRLRTGGQTFQQVTLLAERAMSLARDIDHAVYAADEVRNAVRGGAR